MSKEKFLNFLVNAGGMVGFFITFLTLEPIVNSEVYSTSSVIFYVLMMGLYDVFYWHTLSHMGDKEKAKEHYYRCVKDADKKLSLDLSYEEKFKNLEKYIEDYFNK